MLWTAKGLELSPGRGQEFSPLQIIQTGSGGHPASYPGCMRVQAMTGKPHRKRPFVSSRHTLKNNIKIYIKRITLKSIKLNRIGSTIA
jgi:hypothetical protein